jgi:hypothetical protein
MHPILFLFGGVRLLALLLLLPFGFVLLALLVAHGVPFQNMTTHDFNFTVDLLRSIFKRIRQSLGKVERRFPRRDTVMPNLPDRHQACSETTGQWYRSQVSQGLGRQTSRSSVVVSLVSLVILVLMRALQFVGTAKK